MEKIAHFVNGEFKGYIHKIPYGAKFTGSQYPYVLHEGYTIHQYVKIKG